MKIAFLQYELRDRMGIMMLSALLKNRGHTTNVFTGFDKDLVNKIIEFNPRMLALSSSITEHKFLYKVAKEIKKRDEKMLIALGGPHATFFPEEIYSKKFLDIVCRGEGDEAIIELAERIENNQEYYHTPNLWVRKDRTIVENGLGNLIENLDGLPFPDRDIYYDKYPLLRDNPTKAFIFGRGCPFDCSYCFNHQMRELYRGKGRYVRLPSVDYAIRQIKEVQEKYGFKWVHFLDDTLNYNKIWFSELLKKFKKEINVPYVCNVRIDRLDKKMALKMIDSGVDRISFGIEHGNEKFRKEILNRNMSNKQIVKIAKIFKNHAVRIFTSNIIGLPGETLKLAFETVELNRKIKPEFASGSILVPYPKTDIFKYCLENNYLKKNVTIDNLPLSIMYYWGTTREEMRNTVIKLDRENELVNLYKLLNLLVKYKKLESIIRILMKLPTNNRFYNLIPQIPIILMKIKYSKGIKGKIFHIKGFLGRIFK